MLVTESTPDSERRVLPEESARVRFRRRIATLAVGLSAALMGPVHAVPDADPARITPAAADSAAENPAPATSTGQQAVADPAAPAPSGTATELTLEAILAEVADPLGHIERQIQAQEYDPAMDWLEDRIHSIEASSHRFDPRLVRPLTLLGDAYAGQGEYRLALENYQRAVHLNRVNDGLNATAQVDIVYREANALRGLGEYQQANDREEYAYHVLSRAHAPMDKARLPGIYHLARWYEMTHNIFAARSLYELAVQIIQAHNRLDSPEAIPALQGIATTYRQERFPAYYVSDRAETAPVSPGTLQQPISINNFPAGEAALQQIIKIRQSEETVDSIALAEAVLDLADWYNLFDKQKRALPLYSHAWKLMSEVEGFDVAGYFAEPKLLYFPTPSNPSPPPATERGELSTGYVEVAFGVADTGHVRGLKTVASQPGGLMDFRVRKSLRVSRYRPMLVDGVPVTKESHTYRHEFPYYPEREQDEADKESGAKVAGQ